MTRSELEIFRQALESTDRCRYWTWGRPQIHFPFLAAWPAGYLTALGRWAKLPWRVRQLMAIPEHGPLEPGLRVWRRDLGFELELLTRATYSEREFHLLARAATPAMAFLRGLLWRSDPAIARCQDWIELQSLLAARDPEAASTLRGEGSTNR